MARVAPNYPVVELCLAAGRLGAGPAAAGCLGGGVIGLRLCARLGLLVRAASAAALLLLLLLLLLLSFVPLLLLSLT